VFDAITAGPRDPEQPALEAPNDEDRLDAEAIDVEIVDPVLAVTPDDDHAKAFVIEDCDDRDRSRGWCAP
jgi:hypothetical protein